MATTAQALSYKDIFHFRYLQWCKRTPHEWKINLNKLASKEQQWKKWLHSLTLEEFVNDEKVNFPKKKVYLF